MKGRVVRRFLLGLAPWVGVILIWYGVRLSGFVNESLIPAPHQVAKKFVELLLHENLLLDIYISSQRVFLGVILGVLACALGEIGLFLLVAGPVLGYAIGRSLTYDLCSEPKCRARLPRDLEKCPACKGTLAGVVRSAEEHYVAAADVRRELARLREADRAEAQAVDERREAH